MPSNIFATTGTNVSVLFIDKENKEDVILIDASNLGETIKEDGNQKTVLTHEEEEHIINAFISKEVVDDFSVVVSYDEIKTKNYSLSAGQYFEVKIEFVKISEDQFNDKLENISNNLNSLFKSSDLIEKNINENLKSLNYKKWRQF